MAGLTREQKAAKVLQEKAIELSGLGAEAFEALAVEEKEPWVTKAKEVLEPEAPPETKGKPSASSKDEPDYLGLIKVRLGTDEIYVHPTCLADHKRLGWEEA
jgi:hypothetical protein